MSRLDYDLPNQCHCSVQNKANIPKNVIFIDNNGNNDFENRNNCPRQIPYNQNYQPPDKDSEIDEHTWNKIYGFRDKACKFIRSESECNTSTSDSSFIPCNCRNEKCSRERCFSSNVFSEHAESIVNYSPRSSFLRQMKDKYLFGNPMQNCVPTFPETTELASLCQKCVPRTHQKQGHQTGQLQSVSQEQKLGDQASQLQSAPQEQNNLFCWCKDPLLKSRGMDFILNTCKSAIDEYRNSMIGIKYCQCENCVPMNNEQPIERKNDYRKERSSRRKSKSKKSNKIRDKRKRKSNEDGKYDSQESFEPSLKKPHENSCERCWRYASPSRSPVNKPDQRFDPNFRKSRSCTDFISRDKTEESDSNLEETERVSPSRQANSKSRAEEHDCPSHPRHHTEVKEVLVQPINQRSRTPDRGVQSTSQKPVTPDRGVQPTTQKPGTPDRGVQPTTQRSVTPDRCVQPTTQGPRTPDRGVQPTTQRSVTPDRCVQPTTQGPRTPDRGVQPTTQRPGTPDRCVQSNTQGSRTPDRYHQPMPQRPGTPDRFIQPTTPGPRTPDRSFQPTIQRPGTPDRSIQPTIQRPGTPDRCVQPTTQRPRTPDQYVQPTTQGPRTPDRYVQSMTQAPRTPDRSFQRVPKETGPCEYPESGGVVYSGQARTPRPKSCTPVLSSGEVNYREENLNNTGYMHLQIQTRNQNPNAQELSNRSIRNCENINSAALQENTYTVVRPCEHLNSRQMMNNSVSPSKRPENINSNQCPTHNHQTNAPSWHSNSTVYNEPSVSRNGRPPTPNCNRSNASVRMDQGNKSIHQKSHSPNYVHFKENSPSQMQQTEQLPTTRTSSSAIIQENPPQNYDSRPRSVGYDVMVQQDNNYDFQNQGREFERMNYQKINSSHPFRPCHCCSGSSQVRGTGCSVGSGSDKKLFCCHCRQKEGSRKQSVRCNNENYSFNRQKPQNNFENARPFSQPAYNNQGHYPGSSEPDSVANRCNSSYRPSDDQFMKNFSGKSMQCPYSERYRNQIPLITISPPDNGRSPREKNFPPENAEVNPPVDCQPNYNPTKYSVYYMTKCKDKGNEVEVLVEELTERCSEEKKNSKTKAVKNKMERLLECHSDSMALRFQKGVSDSFRNPQGSRILYF